jgi:thiamine biosynthesis lipoprotein ApbE
MSFSRMTRRSFLSLPAFAPFLNLGSTRNSSEANVHHFAYESVLGTSLDLEVWSSSAAAAERAEQAVLDEIQRLNSILNTRDPASEISLLNLSSS